MCFGKTTGLLSISGERVIVLAVVAFITRRKPS
jgi:hypothetical protein